LINGVGTRKAGKTGIFCSNVGCTIFFAYLLKKNRRKCRNKIIKFTPVFPVFPVYYLIFRVMTPFLQKKKAGILPAKFPVLPAKFPVLPA
jgi:hypothetical protein